MRERLLPLLLLLLSAKNAHRVSFHYQGLLDLAQRALPILLLLVTATQFARIAQKARTPPKARQVVPRVVELSQRLDAKFVWLANTLVLLAAKVVALELVLVVELSLDVRRATQVLSVLIQTEPLA